MRYKSEKFLPLLNLSVKQSLRWIVLHNFYMTGRVSSTVGFNPIHFGMLSDSVLLSAFFGTLARCAGIILNIITDLEKNNVIILVHCIVNTR